MLICFCNIRILRKNTATALLISGRERKRWEDSIREWTSLEFGKSQRAGENREKWRKLSCKIICGAPMTLTVKGLMMMKMMQWVLISVSPYLYVFISVSLGGLCMCPHLYMSHLCVPLTPSLTLYPSTPNLSLT